MFYFELKKRFFLGFDENSSIDYFEKNMSSGSTNTWMWNKRIAIAWKFTMSYFWTLVRCANTSHAYQTLRRDKKKIYMQKAWNGCTSPRVLLKTGIKDRSSCESNLAIIVQINNFSRNGANICSIWFVLLGRFVSGSNRQDYYALISNASNCITQKIENRLIQRRHFVSRHDNIHSFRTTVGNIATRQWLSPLRDFRNAPKYSSSVCKFRMNFLLYSLLFDLIWFRFIISFSCQSSQFNFIERKYKQQVHALVFIIPCLLSFIKAILLFPRSLSFLVACFLYCLNFYWLKTLYTFHWTKKATEQNSKNTAIHRILNSI